MNFSDYNFFNVYPVAIHNYSSKLNTFGPFFRLPRQKTISPCMSCKVSSEEKVRRQVLESGIIIKFYFRGILGNTDG